MATTTKDQILYGNEVYDTTVAWNHAVFRLDEHLERLYEPVLHCLVLITASLYAAMIRDIAQEARG